jgi:hypothetical protein
MPANVDTGRTFCALRNTAALAAPRKGGRKELGVPHALIGGLAVGLHGHPRATKDVDFPEELRAHSSSLIASSGFPIAFMSPDLTATSL